MSNKDIRDTKRDCNELVRCLPELRRQIRLVAEDVQEIRRLMAANQKTNENHFRHTKFLRNKNAKLLHEKRLVTRVRNPISNTDRPGDDDLVKNQRAARLAAELKQKEALREAAEERRRNEISEVVEMRRVLELREATLKRTEGQCSSSSVEMTDDGSLSVTVVDNTPNMLVISDSYDDSEDEV